MSTENPSTLIPFSVMDSIAADCGVDLPAARARAIAAEKARRNARMIREARERDAANAKARESMTTDEVIDDAFDF